MDPLGLVNGVTAMATLTQMLWPIAIGQLVNVSSVSTTLEDFTVTSVYQVCVILFSFLKKYLLFRGLGECIFSSFRTFIFEIYNNDSLC